MLFLFHCYTLVLSCVIKRTPFLYSGSLGKAAASLVQATVVK